MSYAAFVQVEVDPGSSVEHRHSVLNEFILPSIKELDGFKSAVWLNDGQGIGTCIAEFDTEEQAKRSLEVVAPSNGPRVIHAGTCEIELRV